MCVGPPITLVQVTPARRHFPMSPYANEQWACPGRLRWTERSGLWLADSPCPWRLTRAAETRAGDVFFHTFILGLGNNLSPKRPLAAFELDLGLAVGVSASLGSPLRGHTDAVAAWLLRFELLRVHFAADTQEAQPSAPSAPFLVPLVMLARRAGSWVTSCEQFSNGMCLRSLAVFSKAEVRWDHSSREHLQGRMAADGLLVFYFRCFPSLWNV